MFFFVVFIPLATRFITASLSKHDPTHFGTNIATAASVSSFSSRRHFLVLPQPYGLVCEEMGKPCVRATFMPRRPHPLYPLSCCLCPRQLANRHSNGHKSQASQAVRGCHNKTFRKLSKEAILIISGFTVIEFSFLMLIGADEPSMHVRHLFAKQSFPIFGS